MRSLKLPRLLFISCVVALFSITSCQPWSQRPSRQSPRTYRLVKALRDESQQAANYRRKITAQEYEALGHHYLQQLATKQGSIQQYRAVLHLGLIGERAITLQPQIIAELTQTLQRRNSRLRFCAAIALGKIGQRMTNPEPIVDQLLIATQDPAAQVRDAATIGLIRIGYSRDPRMLTALFASLQDPNEAVRSTGAEALARWSYQDPNILPRLERNLATDDPFNQSASAFAIGLMGRRGRSAAPALLMARHDDQVRVRQSVVNALGRIGPSPTIVTALIQSLGDTDPKVSQLARNWLQQYARRDSTIVPQLLAQLNHPNPRIRQAISLTLSRTKAPANSTLGPLLEALGDEDPAVRLSAAATLGKQGRRHVAVRNRLIQVLQSEQPLVQDGAHHALSLIGPAIVFDILPLVSHPSSSVRLHAGQLLWQLSKLPLSYGAYFAGLIALWVWMWRYVKTFNRAIRFAVGMTMHEELRQTPGGRKPSAPMKEK